MEVSKSYLESLSADELIKLADSYGIDVPVLFNRSEIIGELLEIAESFRTEDSKSSFTENESKEINAERTNTISFKERPYFYNRTEIRTLARDPMWLFVFWDFSYADFKKYSKKSDFDCFFLRVLLFKGNDKSPSDYYDIDVLKTDRSRYIYLSFDDVLTRVDLCMRLQNKSITTISQSNFFRLDRKNIPNILCVLDSNISMVSHLSGLSILKKNHFKNYRLAFPSYKESLK